MGIINRAALFEKLNPTLFQSLESATRFARYRSHARVDMVHWLNQILLQNTTDLHLIVAGAGIDAALLSADITESIERLPQSQSGIDFSPDIERAAERSWIYASLRFGSQRVRSAHLLLALLDDATSCQLLKRTSQEWQKITAPDLLTHWERWLAGSSEKDDAAPISQQQESVFDSAGDYMPHKGSAIQKFTRNLTELARQGEIDKVSCREAEIRQLVDILIRRRQNNPLLVGEAGVGKTAVAEGLALRIAEGTVPPPLKDVQLLELDIAMMQAGASVKGEFENRLKQLISEVQSLSTPAILFIDEAHTLIGAGGAAGTGDAANLLKPALARGKLRTIAATTWSEYKKHIEKDPALTRRFQVIHVQEPTERAAIEMIRAVMPVLQSHHRVAILDEAVVASVKLSLRYIPARQLPDKAISLLDTACARVSVSHSQHPFVIETLQSEIGHQQRLIGVLEQEMLQGIDHAVQLQELRSGLDGKVIQHSQLVDRWNAEHALVKGIVEQSRRLTDVETQDKDSVRQQLNELQKRLDAVQEESKLVHACVDRHVIAEVVAEWTGIPVGKMLRDEQLAILRLPEALGQRVLGQDHAINEVCEQLKISRAGLEDPAKPIGVFLLVGPSGVGKTETALALAEQLYGGEEHLICINMSEFQEPHTVSTLKGAPPGYVGYGEGGVLTEAVRRRPYSVVLLDEIEKAHRDIHEIFYQVFDKGWMEDGEGRYIDFRNTLILMTANVGDDLIHQLCEDPELAPRPDVLVKELRDPLRKVFPPAFLGRVKTVPYYPLSPDLFKRLVAHKLNKVAGRLEGRYKLKLKWNEQVLSWIHKRIDHVESGARLIDAVINTEILSPLSTALLVSRETFSNEIHLRLSDDGKPIFASGAGSDTAPPQAGESSVQPYVSENLLSPLQIN